MDREALNLLRRVGLNQYESKVYLALLHSGTSSASKVSSVASIPRPRTYDVLDKLEKKGFVSMQPGRPTKFMANNLSDSFTTLKRSKETDLGKELKEIESIKIKLEKRIDNAEVNHEVESSDFVWVLKKRSNIYSKLESLINNAQESILISTTKQGLSRKIQAYDNALRKARDRGVDIKIISSADQKYMQQASKYAKVIKKSHDNRFVIVDDNVMLFLTPETEKKEVGAWIKSPYFARNIRKLV